MAAPSLSCGGAHFLLHVVRDVHIKAGTVGRHAELPYGAAHQHFGAHHGHRKNGNVLVYVLLCTDKQDKHHYRKQNQNQRGQAQPGKTLAAEGKHADKAADGQNRVDDALHIQLFAVGFLKHCIVGAGRHQQRNAHHSRSDQQPGSPSARYSFQPATRPGAELRTLPTP